MLGGLRYDDVSHLVFISHTHGRSAGITNPHVSITLQWDSREQAESAWADIYANKELMANGGEAGPGNPFWPKGEPLKHYARIESSWMVCAHPQI